MVSIACSICATFSALQASKVFCTTDCSAHRLRPKARCKAASARKRVLISTSPCAPASMLIKASESLSVGRSLMVFWAICTVCSIGSNSFSSLNFIPMAAKLAQPVNCFVVGVVDSFMMILLLQSSDSTRGMAHLCSFGKLLSCGILPLVWAKFRYLEAKRHLGAYDQTVIREGTRAAYPFKDFVREQE